MEVIVKSSPKIEIELATKVVKVDGKVTVDSALSTESENPVMNKVITEELRKSPFEKGSAENSAILKGEYEGYSNKAISQTAVAIGAGTIAGLKGWYYSNIDFTNKKITLSDKKVTNRYGVLNGGGWSSGTPNIKLGDVISIVNDSKFDFCSKVTIIDGYTITVDSLPFNSIANGVFSAIDDNTIYIPNRPDAGIIDFGGGAFAEGGINTKASNICAHAEGLTTHAYGQYSHTEGRETKAGYAAHAEGNNTTASGNASHSEGYETSANAHQSHTEGWLTSVDEKARAGHAEGYNTRVGGEETTLTAGSATDWGIYSHAEGNATQAIGYNSHAEGKLTKALGAVSHAEGVNTVASGYGSHAEGVSTQALKSQSHAEGEGCIANGQRSHAEGYFTETNNQAEHAEGKYNKSNNTTIHSVGIGTASERKNAHEITNDGKHYIYGIGGYDGTTIDGATDLATIINGVKQCGGITPTTWAELKALRDAGALKAGTFYRITDYVTTTTQENTQSAGHAFDIVVLALDERTLSERANAMPAEGDTYFTEAGANLSAWQIWYSLDNDTSRFAWADSSNGKGVIYRMIDEWNNDCPYDFKNIQFIRNLIFENGYAEFSEDGEETWVYTFAGQSYHINNDEWSGMLDGSLESPFGHMSDENTSTFHDNTIKPYIMVYNGNDIYTECGLRYLNDIVFLGYWEKVGSANEEDMPYYYAGCCNSNSFGNNCYSNSFGNDCNYNSFGNYCYSNSFTDDGEGISQDIKGLAHNVTHCLYDDGVHDVTMYYDDISDAYESIMNIHIYRGVHDVSYTPQADTEAEQSFCCNHYGEIVPFFLVDIITKVNDL